MTDRWLCHERNDGEIHVIPIDDAVEHQTDGDCPCGPSPEFIPAADGPDGWMQTHHSLEGREQHE